MAVLASNLVAAIQLSSGRGRAVSSASHTVRGGDLRIRLALAANVRNDKSILRPSIRHQNERFSRHYCPRRACAIRRLLLASQVPALRPERIVRRMTMGAFV